LRQPGDTLVVWHFDRLGCSFKQGVEQVEELQQRQLGLRSLHEQIDTAGPAQLRLIAALVACERTLTGLGIARAGGRLGGRKPKMTPEMVNAQLMQNPAVSVHEICKTLKGEERRCIAMSAPGVRCARSRGQPPASRFIASSCFP